MKIAVILSLMFVTGKSLFAQQKILLSKQAYVRHGASREWLTFPEKVKDSLLTISFDATSTTSATISLIQYDVTHDWKVSLNNKHLGNLVVDEQRMLTYLGIPAGVLKKKNNVLKIYSETGNYANPDDIIISKITLHNNVAFNRRVNIKVTSDTRPIPSKLTIINSENAFQPVAAASGDTLAIRPGVVYSGTGNFSFSLPQGEYRIYASRGFEYSVDSAVVGDTKDPQHPFNKTLTLKHEVSLPDWISFDPHVHTKEYSGHGDASMKERVLTIAGEGLNYAVITEHNRAVNIKDTVEKMNMSKWFTAITGNELTTRVGHFNMFPVKSDAVPSADGVTWDKIAGLRKAQKQIVIFNHTRDVHSGFRPSDSTFFVKPDIFPANAMEVMNSGSQQSDPRQLYIDWMRLWGRGVKLSAIGSSDSHDVCRFIVGQGRTYVSADGDLIDNILAHKTAVSFGLLTELMVDSIRKGDKARIIVKVHTPSWITPATIDVYANGQKIYTSTLSDKHKQVGNFYEQELSISLPQHEVTLVAIAEGPDPRVPWWPINKPYQHTSPEVNPIVLGISAPREVK